MTTSQLRIHHIEPISRANGPGWRSVIWFQGCSLGCPGCFNPETHLNTAGTRLSVDDLFRKIQSFQPSIEGISLSGGEPFQQVNGLLEFVKRIKTETPLSVLIFSGYTWQEIQRMPKARQLLAFVDILLAGRYDQNQRLASGLIGSSNKTVHFLSGKYSAASLEDVPEAEVIIKENGEVILSGINPIKID